MNESQRLDSYLEESRRIPTREEIQQAIYREQITGLFQQFQLAFIAIVLIAPLFVVYLNHANNLTTTIVWLVVFWVISLARQYHCHRFFSMSPVHIDYQKWEKEFLFGTAVSGLLWGSVAFLFFPENNQPQQGFLFFILAGLSGGALSTLSYRPMAFRLFILSMIVPYLVKLSMLGGQENIIMVVLLTLFVLISMTVSARIYQTITESLQLRYEKDQLLLQYRQLETNNSQTSTDLQAEIKNKLSSERALQESDAFLRSILITANDVIITTDQQGIILSANPAAKRDFGFAEHELVGKSITSIMADNMRDKHNEYMQSYLHNNKAGMVGRTLEVEGQRKDGTLFPIEITVSEAHINNRSFFTGIIRDISTRKSNETRLQETMRDLKFAKHNLELANSELKHSNIELLDQSQHDELTQLANRRFLMTTLHHEWYRCQRNQQPLSLIILDIDFFKAFNDHYGHQEGDDCLVKISQALSNSLSRSSDFIARYGGEEFIAVIPETDLDGAQNLAEKMRQATIDLAIPHTNSDVADYVTVSAGVACMYPKHTANCDMLISMADQALYQAKSKSRNNVQCA